jgi:alpha-galactosidase
MSRADVQAHVIESVSRVLESAPIDYVKWDMNRNFAETGSAALPPCRQGEVHHRYMLGLYRVLEEITSRFPHILFESCSGGGGRFDPGMLYYMPQTWTSDNTDALCRCQIQYSTSLVFPPFAMGSHVSAVPNHQTGRITPIETRGNVAMSGCFGYELDLNTLSADELEKVRQQVKRVKELRNTLLYGDFHRLLSPYEGNDTAWITVSKDKSEAVFMLTRALAKSGTAPILVKLRGLDESKVYTIQETGESYSGSELMNLGVSVRLPWGDAASVSWTLKAE